MAQFGGCSDKLLLINVKGCIVKSTYIAEESVDVKKYSAVLNILVPYPFCLLEDDSDCCSISVLLRTDKFIIVDLYCFCGLVEIPIPVFVKNRGFSNLVEKKSSDFFVYA